MWPCFLLLAFGGAGQHMPRATDSYPRRFLTACILEMGMDILLEIMRINTQIIDLQVIMNIFAMKLKTLTSFIYVNVNVEINIIKENLF